MPRITTQTQGAVQDAKKHIIAIARQFFSEYSYLGASMNDIARKLNITKAALYYHFAGKAEIYKKVLDEVFADLSQTISSVLKETTVERKLLQLIKSYIDFGAKEKNLIKALMLKLSPQDSQITDHIAALRERVVNLIQPVIEEAVTHKKLIKKVDSRNLASLLTSMMDGLLLEYSFFNRKIDSEKIANLIMSALF
ncbi:MAG: TetR/AcrR family transcriptional regulator [Candidatus Aminicenantes bacterium]|nr:TetR/AcrR family transcriptional regulator [Candidatus Aminicenantes bacterium]